MQTSVNIDITIISEVLSRLQSAEFVPVGARGKIFSALDDLRATGACPKQIRMAEQIAVAMQRWELARRRQDEEVEKSVRETLNMLAVDWSETSQRTSEPPARSAEQSASEEISQADIKN